MNWADRKQELNWLIGYNCRVIKRLDALTRTYVGQKVRLLLKKICSYK